MKIKVGNKIRLHDCQVYGRYFHRDGPHWHYATPGVYTIVTIHTPFDFRPDVCVVTLLDRNLYPFECHLYRLMAVLAHPYSDPNWEGFQ